GFIKDSVFRPSSAKAHGADFICERLGNGIAGGATMATLTGSSIGLGRLGASDAISGSFVKSVLNNQVGTGVLSAVPSGLVSAEAQALKEGKTAPTLAEAGDHIYQMAFVGGALGAAHKFGLGGRNDLKHQDVSTLLKTGSIESIETTVQRAERLNLAKDM